MGVQVASDYARWLARYPEFAGVDEPTYDLYFEEAEVYHRNDGVGPIETAEVQSRLLDMMTAHIAARYAAGPGGAAASQLVGRINSATEGSVSVGIEGFTGIAPSFLQWLTTTKYGSDYWYATSSYRTMRYRPGPRRIFDPIVPTVFVRTR